MTDVAARLCIIINVTVVSNLLEGKYEIWQLSVRQCFYRERQHILKLYNLGFIFVLLFNKTNIAVRLPHLRHIKC